MNYSLPAQACRILYGQPRILHPAPIDERARAVGQSREGHGRNGLDGFAKFSCSLLYLPDTHSKSRPKQRQENSHTQRAEPVRLVVGGRNREVQSGTLLVPDPAVIAGHDPESIVTGREIRVLHLTDVHYLAPLRILSLELETKAHLLWRDQAERGVVD